MFNQDDYDRILHALRAYMPDLRDKIKAAKRHGGIAIQAEEWEYDMLIHRVETAKSLSARKVPMYVVSKFINDFL
jgi:hypothetical protein